MKKLVSLVLALALLVSMPQFAFAQGTPGLSNFQRVNTYRQGQFADIPATHWGAENVKAVYEYGLMVGTSGDKFSPTIKVSVSQAIALACRLHSIYCNDGAEFSSSSPWYQSYVDYGREEGFIGEGDFDYERPITRMEFATLICAALPEEALTPINSVEDGAIPDVPMYFTGEVEYIFVSLYTNYFLPCLSDAHIIYYCDAIYALYRSGIVTGSDKKGSYKPYDTIDRASAAAIITRVADPALRQSCTLKAPAFTPVPLNKLANLSALRGDATDAQMQQAYNAAVQVAKKYANLCKEEQLFFIMADLRSMFDREIEYSMTAPNYGDPYGYFISKKASCAGCTRATGMCLNILGISFEHVNAHQYSHQWCRVKLGNEYWICDPFGLYTGIEPAPYKHPFL